MFKKVFLVFLFSSVILLADTLKLIGVDKVGNFELSDMDLTGVKSIQSFIKGSLKSFDPSLPKKFWSDVQPFTSLQGGKGYWVILYDKYANKIFKFDGEPITLNDVKLENNNLDLVAFPDINDISTVIDFFKNKGYVLKSIQSFIKGSLKSFDPFLPKKFWSDVQPFTSLQGGKGYWVIFEKIETPPSVPIDINNTTSENNESGLLLPPSVPNNIKIK